MATSRGSKQYVREVNLVERQPTKSKGSNVAVVSSSPHSSPPSSPKAVRFAPSKSGVVTGVSRELNPTEAWSLYHFECHAKACSTCRDPFQTYVKRGQLCETGHALAQDVALHVHYTAGEIYSTAKDKQKLVRVELEPGYDQVRSLLKGLDHRLRSKPTITYDRSQPSTSRRTTTTQQELDPSQGRKEVIIEPGDSRKDKSSGRKSRQKSTRYKTTVVQEPDSDPEPSSSKEPAKPRERRGSLYYSDQQRNKKKYHVEERAPQWERNDKEERRKGGYYA